MLKCILIEDEPLARKSIEGHLLKIGAIDLIASFENPLSASIFLMENEVDVIFSDIQMPEINGMDFLKTLKDPPLFIFITGNPEYAAESYDLAVFDYILKPLKFERLLASVTRAQKALATKERVANRQSKFLLRDNNRTYLLPHEDIVYIQGSREYVHLITLEKEFVFIKSLKEIITELPADSFMRVQKSFIVNLNYIKALETDKIILKGSFPSIPLGPGFRDDLLMRLGI